MTDWARADWVERCARCGGRWGLADLRWRCDCGGLLDFEPRRVDPVPRAERGPTGGRGMWRYGASLPWAGSVRPGSVTLGETETEIRPVDPGLWLKLDQNLPTGSFKARGAAVMLGVAAGLGVARVVADSSGNAGQAVGAYAAAAGMAAEVFVPHSTGREKISAIAATGASVVTVRGDRTEAARAAVRRVEAGGGWYASHVHQPAFHHGVKTLAFELYEQVPGVAAGTVIVPAGNGSLVLGLWLGFGDLHSCGRIDQIPALVAVQAHRCAPLAFLAPSGPTAATGIAIPDPPRAGQVRAAVLASGGQVVTVGEPAIMRAQGELEHMGVDVEPTAATGWAALEQVERPAPPVVVVITGR